MAFYLQLRTKTKLRPFANPSIFHFYSTFDSNDDKADDESSSNSKSLLSSYLSDVKKNLNQQQPTSPSSTPLKSPPSYFSASKSPPPRSSKVSSWEEIQRNLSEFRLRSSTPTPGDPNVTPSSSSQHISIQELYKRNVTAKSSESMGNADTATVTAGGRPSFDTIRGSLQQLRSSGSSQIDKEGRDPLSISAFIKSFNLKPSASTSSGTSSTLIGGTSTLPASVFGKEMREMEGEGTAATRSKAEFFTMYSYDQLGEKLRALRPEAKGREWFSLEELNERLIKLREIEEKNAESTVKWGPLNIKVLRYTLAKSDDEKAKKSWEQRIGFMSLLGKTPTFMMEPPKEHLVEKYFHPDNLSSAEKLKIELAKVRDEFKMSESDCGSARVQVAQLTTKIKHLSSVLHKKDKHSRKGLQAMVQSRKRLLKYLRRTDWDSYCFVISKLGLRDNPDLKY